jgi:predicted Zn-dependent peptidase
MEGVPVYYKHLPWAPCINIHVVFRTGGFSDPEGKEGLSHFLEHMIFDGSPKLKDKKAVGQWSKKYAIHSWNAWTSMYETSYHLRCLPENFPKALEGMKDMIFRPYLREADVEHERKVITQEAWKRFKNAKYLAYTKDIIRIIAPGHHLSRIDAPLGWPETVAKISHSDIKKWHAEKYVKSNMYIVIAGAFDKNQLGPLSRFIENIPDASIEQYEKKPISKPLELKVVKDSGEIGDPKEQVEITISRFSEPLSLDMAQTAALARYVLADILFERLRNEKSLCYSVRVESVRNPDLSAFFMNIHTSPDHIESVQDEFWAVLEEFAAGKYKNKFAVLKRVAVEAQQASEHLSKDIIGTAVGDIGKYGKVVSQAEILRKLKRISYDDIVSFLKETFDPAWTFTEILLPA